MIPPDVASALRVALIESQNQAQLPQKASPVAPTQRITDALSNLVPGQRIFAEVQGMQANGTYRALVGQREITLSLPFSAKAGDSLELEVAESDGKITLAFVANRTEQAAKLPVDSAATQLSRTAQLISNLQGNVDSPGKRAPPAQLNGNQALIQRMPETGAELAPVLKQAVTQSGVFYEAHQARWVAGQMPTAALRQEPQGRLSVALTPNSTLQNALPPTATNQSPPALPGQQIPGLMVYAESKAALLGPLILSSSPSAQNHAANLPNSGLNAGGGTIVTTTPEEIAPGVLLQSAPGPELKPEPKPAPQGSPAVNSENSQESPSLGSESARPLTPPTDDNHKSAYSPRESAAQNALTSRQDTSSPQSTLASAGLPREISGIVQQQLDGLATQNFVWQGQAWPGQAMHWEINADPDGRSLDKDETTERIWQTRLKLSLTHLGGIDAVIRLQPGGQVAISVNADSSSGEALMRGATEPLTHQLAAAGLTLTQLQIIHEPSAE